MTAVQSVVLMLLDVTMLLGLPLVATGPVPRNNLSD